MTVQIDVLTADGLIVDAHYRVRPNGLLLPYGWIEGQLCMLDHAGNGLESLGPVRFPEKVLEYKREEMK